MSAREPTNRVAPQYVTERLRRPDLGHLEIEITLDDQGAFRKTWTGTKYAMLTPDVELQEYVCHENHKDVAHTWSASKNMVGVAGALRRSGSN